MITAIGPQLRCASMHLISDDGSNPASRSKGRAKSKHPQTIRRVAVVEDELMVAWSIETMLEDLGHEVIGLYPSGEKALLALAGADVDLLCMDINLGSGIDGIETARRIRETQPASVLFISAYSDAATRSRALETVPGAAFLGKPFGRSALKQAIEDFDPRSN